MSDRLWKYASPGIPDELFERLPGIPMTQREIRLLIISALKLENNSLVWDIGAGTGTIPVEIGLLCPHAQIIAIERDEDVTSLIRLNCDRFGVDNVQIVEGSAPACLQNLPTPPQRVCIEGGKDVKSILTQVWEYLPIGGRVVLTAASLETLYQISEGLTQLHARNVEVVQAAVNRLESRGTSRRFSAIDPIFILSGEKME
jgi:cobalt-precorrin-6B (C15)-methyltransferase